MPFTPQQSATEILSLFVASGARPGRSFPVNLGKLVTEPRTVPTDGKVTVNNGGAFAWDGGVSYAVNGAAFALVSSAPAPGQYAQSGGSYQFNIGDALTKVQIAYRLMVPQPQLSGALQTAFVAAGYAQSDLINGLAYALSQNYLSLGNAFGDSQVYVLELAGWTEGGGTAPTAGASAQQLINVAAAINATPGGGRFELKSLIASFVGTVGGNTFAPEDAIAGYGTAFGNGWIRPCGQQLTDMVFALTAAGVAEAT